MNYYHIWANLKNSARDVEFARNVEAYLGHLRDQGLIEGFRITRRKLGFGPDALGDFHLVLEVRDLAQLEAAFQRVGTRAGEVEGLHRAVYSAVKDLQFALYRDFPDPFRGVEE
jgi:hypothetical protein